ncbi:MAG: hypothetical protein PHT07_23935 [Paludibacter sp.]|nr:hypothetical protein [Paludibacter sp.]
MLEITYFDMIIVFLYYGAASVFNWLGYRYDIPIVQMATFGAILFAIVPFLEMLKDAALPIYGASTLLFVLVNAVLFIMGMVKYRRGSY